MLESRERRLALAFLIIAALFTQWSQIQGISRAGPAISIVEHGTLYSDQFYNMSYDRVVSDGHYYFNKAPGTMLVGIPIYLFTKAVGLYTPMPPVWEYEKEWIPLRDTFSGPAPVTDVFMIPSWSATTILFQFLIIFATGAVPGAILLVLLHRYLRYQDYSERTSIAVPAALGLGTFFIWHSTRLYALLASGALAFAALYLIETRDSDRIGLYAGILAGLAPVFTYYGGLMTAILVIYQFRQRDRWKRFLGGAVLGFSPFLIYNTLAFGAPWELPYLQDSLYRSASVDPTLISHLTPSEVLFGVFLWKPHHLLMNAINLTIAPSRGLFFLAPVFLLAIVGLWRSAGERRKRLLWTVALPFIVYLLFNSSLTMWEGGISLGPRYMVPMLPFLAIGVAEGIRQLGEDRWILFLLLMAPSAIIGYSGFINMGTHPTIDVGGGEQLRGATLLSYGPAYNPLPEYWERMETRHGPESPLINLLSGRPDMALNHFAAGDEDLALLAAGSERLLVLSKPWIELLLVLLIAYGASVGELLRSRRQYLYAIGLGIILVLTLNTQAQQTYYGAGWEQTERSIPGHYNMTLSDQGTVTVTGGPPHSSHVFVEATALWNDTAMLRIGDTVRDISSPGGASFPVEGSPPYHLTLISENGCHRPALYTSRSGVEELTCRSMVIESIDPTTSPP